MRHAARRLQRRSSGVALVAMMLVAVFALPADAAGGSGTSTLYSGQKLKVGQCIKVTGYYKNKASFCMGGYGDANLKLNGKTCSTTLAGNHTPASGAYITVTSKGDVRVYQYAGGRMLWHSDSGYFTGGHLVIAATAGGKAELAIDNGKAYFPWASCPKGNGLG